MQKTDGEKWDFLEMLYKYGSDVNVLKNMLPTWKTSEIEYFMKRFRSRAQKKLLDDERTSKNACLNHWAKICDNLHQLQGTTNQPWWRKGRKKMTEEPKDHAPLLSKTLMYAACFEDHYQGSGPDDPNYSEIYRYLSQLVMGKEPTQLTPASAAKVLEMLNKIKKVVTHESGLDSLQLLQNLEVSYLPHNPGHSKKREVLKNVIAENESSECASPTPSCPLFQDEGEDDHLEPGDPYYELKKEDLANKIKKKQQQEIQNLHIVTGLNPMEIPSSFLVKPTVAIFGPQNL